MQFIPAKAGDIPLYKLARMGLPMPTEHGAGPDANISAESSVPGSAVPTLELDNGDSSEEDEKKARTSDDDDDGIMMVATSRTVQRPKKRIKSDSPEAEAEAETDSLVTADREPAKRAGSVDTRHIEVLIEN